MYFEEWWSAARERNKVPMWTSNKATGRLAFNDALEIAAKLVEERGKKIGGAIQSDQTALSIRSLIQKEETC
jgi:hypothetical protein